MDVLKKTIAPITEQAWEEIETLAADILKVRLSARKFIDVSQPKGWDYAAEPEGRLHLPEGQPRDKVRYGIHKVQPLVEVRKSFTLDTWELDNVVRGAKDIDLDALEQATREMADFEENVIYNGLDTASIPGLLKATDNEPITSAMSGDAFLGSLNQAVSKFQKWGIGGPYNLVINPRMWEKMSRNFKGYPLRKHISDITEGKVIFSEAIDSALIVSSRGGDFELILGHDYEIGYESHTHEKVQFFITESFTFRILEPKAIIQLKINQSA